MQIMLCSLQYIVKNSSFGLGGKQSKHPQKYNGKTLPRCGSNCTVR